MNSANNERSIDFLAFWFAVVSYLTGLLTSRFDSGFVLAHNFNTAPLRLIPN
jgi:hypothetical protein